MQSRENACAFCSNSRVDAAEAEAVMRLAGFDPLGAYPGAAKPWPCICVTCRRKVSPQYQSVRRGGGCRFCASHGLNLVAPGVVYLLRHESYFALKIGVTSRASRQDRVAAHRANGWELARAWDVDTGHDAEMVENGVLRWWRDELGVPAAVTRGQMATGGWSETASMLWVDVETTSRHVEAQILRLRDCP
ncbi:MAG: hypothetical protein ABMA25_02320 [Ilumatobacteraceae bacterium]